MIYSVFDWQNGQYKYYADKQPKGVAPQPVKRSARKTTPIGAAPDDVLVLVPKDAVLVGVGPEAKGYIAALGDDSGSGIVTGVVIIGLVIWGFTAFAKKLDRA